MDKYHLHRPRLTSDILEDALYELDERQRKNILLDAECIAAWVPGVGRVGALEILARLGEFFCRLRTENTELFPDE